MALDKISDILLAIFVSISLPIYIIFLVAVLKNRSKEPFNSAFFTLVVSLGIADVLNEIQDYLFIKTAGWGWFEEFWLEYGSRGSFLALYSNAMLFGLPSCQYLGVLLLTINRFTAIVFLHEHDRIWSHRNTVIAIVLQWIIPVIYVLPMSLSTFEYTFYIENGIADNSSISVNFCDDNFTTGYYICLITLQFAIFVSTLFMYIAVFVSALKHAKKMRTLNDSSNGSRQSIASPFTAQAWRRSTVASLVARQTQKSISNYQRELRLAFSGLLLFLVMFACTVYLMLIVITGDPNWDGGLMYNIVCDVFSCINPYTLLIMSTQTRAAFMKTVRCGQL